ncbi:MULTISPECIES: ImmA/IrrE family metallo-endopeptidase [unclassified Rhizobium]|uniref:helix-turn-helix domain-containing protein n=1 Tax=unclassified Rhizobium TaxID=2613769 RepID=UPI001469E63F|nr:MULTISPECIES: ImmA/IrrE family metallo-endopeptidase [unclassified Rhizobium]MBD9445737.1 ImmA/IrrE family metallo-endopeptidase [Rhizobium sp. RHZ01]NMN73836.1 Zn-dependent peptidase ImmA (M78 family) [Rhizobium sp. 57MFTsu3.2]
MFNSKRLCLARMRRRLTAKGLADLTKLSAMTITRLEKGDNQPDEGTVARIAAALAYPVGFFYADDPEELNTEAVSFRSLTKMSARERDAAISAGSLGLQLSEWVEKRFSLPAPNLLDLSYETDVEAAARSLREHWGLGEKPIGNVIGLLETQGIRVLSLSENTRTVDAFSFWRDERPYIFLNNFKTAEHSLFDSVHELGHLVLHQHGGPQGNSRVAEREANAFASAFLMPANDVRARAPRFIDTSVVIKMKSRWRVSAMAMAYRLHVLGRLSEWQYKSICIELGKRGYRNGEPNGIQRETSIVWKKVFAQLWHERVTKNDIGRELGIPLDELDGLVWGLTGISAPPPKARALSAV